MKKLLAILVLGLLWCTYSNAGFLSREAKIANINACKQDQYSSPNNQGISRSKLDKYCVCYINRIDQALTKKDVDYLKKNGRYPKEINSRVFQASKQCYFEVIQN